MIFAGFRNIDLGGNVQKRMITFMEILKIILPSCITGLATFLVTKYNYYKNVPLDKLAVAYDRIYYPIYRLVCNNGAVSVIIEKSERYLNKYHKYVARSTLKAFTLLRKSPDDADLYTNYKNNIYNMSTKLKRRLGYLEPNFLNVYVYSAPNEQRVIRILVELIGVYISVFGVTLIHLKTIQYVLVVIFLAATIGLGVEVLCVVWRFVKRIVKSYLIKDRWEIV